MPDWFWYIAGPVLLVAVLGYLWYTDRQRSETVKRKAAELDWSYHASDRRYSGRFPGDPFESAWWRRARHVLHGTRGNRPFTAFELVLVRREYRPRRGVRGLRRLSSDSDRDYRRRLTLRRYQVVLVELPVAVPDLDIARRGFLGRTIRSRFGLSSKDVDLTGQQIGTEEFDAEFEIATADPEFARRMFTPDACSWLLRSSLSRESPVRIHGNEMVTWREGRINPTDAKKRARYLHELADHVPTGVAS
ncbi:hypothetical protein [Haloechinothrix sp. LS1_15]|uniref:hypothetical protein n=1 Tax=Haloechinothrix sp. LS1_15 TaxID=2652248 RepID=UPI002944F6FA|nr:hypothetical protein [Haloechinothrix sp. LS1_15]MDV6013293.1 hypothetical protein [Haloechinothrix sp. LS1_15]